MQGSPQDATRSGRQTLAQGWVERLEGLVRRGLDARPIDRADAAWTLAASADAPPLAALAGAAGRVRRAHCGRRVQVHILNNVQNGACPEDCGYCGQARTSEAPIKAYRLKPFDQILAEAHAAKAGGAFRYCMVLSGRGPDDEDIEHMAACIRAVKEQVGIETCLSSGLLDEKKAERLKDAGLDRLNHNLNTSQRWYPQICTTHTYDDRVRTLRSARGAGLQICSGLIVGLGETREDLLDVAYALAAMDAESIPVNFLVPIEGNQVVEPLSDGRPLTPGDCLRVLCMMRFVNPRAEVRMAAGREIHLRSLQAMALEPANSLFVEGYLLTRGEGPIRTLRMIGEAGYEVELHGPWPEDLRRLVESGEQDAVDGDGASQGGVLKESVISPRKLARLRVRGAEVDPSPSV